MAKRPGVILLVLMTISLVGLLVVWIARSQASASRSACKMNMKGLALGLAGYHDIHRRYPTATIPNPALPPEKRLSWLLDMPSSFGIGGGIEAWWPVFDRDKAWDDTANYPVKERNLEGQVREMTGGFDFLCCPGDPAFRKAAEGHRTMYVGATGLGEDAAALPIGDPRVGFFGYERKLLPLDITDGLSVTVAITETGRRNGYWSEGGLPTARGLVVDDFPYLGIDGQFSSRHPLGSSPFTLRPPTVSNFAFADGSVRAVGEDVAPDILSALFTIRGGEKQVEFEE